MKKAVTTLTDTTKARVTGASQRASTAHIRKALLYVSSLLQLGVLGFSPFALADSVPASTRIFNILLIMALMATLALNIMDIHSGVIIRKNN